METKHTQGPWTQFENGANIGTSDGYAICDMALGYSSLSNEELEANARLIAAAPELLGVLQELRESADYWSEYDVPCGIVERMDAVIAKATTPNTEVKPTRAAGRLERLVRARHDRPPTRGKNMGLDTSHDAFHGAYSAFNSLRQEVAYTVGGSYGPHWLRDYHGEIARDKDGYPIRDTTLDSDKFYLPDEITREAYPGLWEFLTHSDCDGEISPEMCVMVANDLEALLPKMPEGGAGHIAARGGYREVLRKFIAGCRAAAAEGVPLDFH